MPAPIPAAVKARVLQRILVAHESRTKVAQDEGINRSTITRWLKKANAHAATIGIVPETGVPTAPPPPASTPISVPKSPTDAIIATVVKVLQDNGQNQEAADIASIPIGRLNTWLSDGASDFEDGVDTPEARLSVAVRKADAQARMVLIGSVVTAANRGDFRAAMFLLSSKAPKRFGNKSEGQAVEDNTVKDGIEEVKGMVAQVQAQMKRAL